MRNKAPYLPAFLLISLIFGSCDYDSDLQNPAGELPIKGNYFPTSLGSHWTYERKAMCEWPDQSTVCVTTNQSRAEGDELPWDNTYEPYSSATASFQFVKVIDHEYLGYGYYLPEYKFLDDGLSVNHTWTFGEGQIQKEEFRILEVNAVKTIRDIEYHDVIVVQHTIFFQAPPCRQVTYEPVSTTVRYYAKDIGEIYMRYKYNYGGTTEASELFLTDYHIAQ